MDKWDADPAYRIKRSKLGCTRLHHKSYVTIPWLAHEPNDEQPLSHNVLLSSFATSLRFGPRTATKSMITRTSCGKH
eukprot:12584432-Prorocentrum_lima.AAC.1